MEIHKSKARNRVVVIGRRGGKTVLTINELIVRAVEKPGLYWFVAPTYRQAKGIAWPLLKKFLRVDDNWNFNEADLRAELKAIGATIELKGADNEDSLRGVGLAGVVMDESATMKKNVWPEIIRPMLMDTGGWALFIGTPKGLNWFYDLYQQAGAEPGWKRWNFPTAVNKYIPEAEIEIARREMPARLFEQEIQARFLEGDAGVFRGIDMCLYADLMPPALGRDYVIGVDLAKHQDWTVLTVIDRRTRQVVDFERFNNVEWPIQKDRIQAKSLRYNKALCYVDSTGIGDPIVDDLQRMRVPVVPFKFNNTSKRQLIEHLSTAIEQRKILLPNVPELIHELRRYELEVKPNGTVVYNAPDGEHDDCVISLALAAWGLKGEIMQSLATDPDPEDEDDIQTQRIRTAKHNRVFSEVA